MKLISKKTITGLLGAMVFVVAAVFTPAVSVSAQETTEQESTTSCGTGISGGVSSGINCARGTDTPGQDIFGEGSIFTTVVNILLFIIGALSVVMLIWGGIRYTTSGGQSAAVTSAKNTIMYAIIGLIVAFLAFAIINWVLDVI